MSVDIRKRSVHFEAPSGLFAVYQATVSDGDRGLANFLWAVLHHDAVIVDHEMSGMLGQIEIAVALQPKKEKDFVERARPIEWEPYVEHDGLAPSFSPMEDAPLSLWEILRGHYEQDDEE